MTAAEHLKCLEELAKCFSHSEPIPEANKDLSDKISDLCFPDALRELMLMGMEIHTANVRAAYRANGEEFDRFEQDKTKPSWLDRLMGLVKQAEPIYMGSRPEIAPALNFGVLPIGTLDAVSLKVPKSKEFLIVLNEGTFMFLYLFTKIMILAEQESATVDDQGRQVFYVRGRVRKKMENLICRYVLHGRPTLAEPWVMDPKYLAELAALIDVAELFVALHEVAHIQCGHLRSATISDQVSERTKPSPTLTAREREADVIGGDLTIATLGEATSLMLCLRGIQIAICARKMIDNAVRLMNGEVVRQNAIADNRRSKALIQALSGKLGHHFGQSAAFSIIAAERTAAVAEVLWESVVPKLIEKRNAGAKPVLVWSPVS